MNWDINVAAGLVAGLAAMVPGAVIYDLRVLGTRWMTEIGTSPEKQKKAGADPMKAIGMMLITSLVNGLVASAAVSTAGAHTVAESFLVCMVLAWFLVSANLSIVFFERRSWTWFGIGFLNTVTTFAVIGVVLGLFIK